MREKLASPMEARLMLLLIVRGFPEFEVNYPIRVHSGECYYGDIVFVKERTIVEYDGVFHQTQWERDSERRNRLEESGWRYVQVTRNDFASADAEQLLADRIGAALKSQTGRTYMTIPVTTLDQLAKQRLEEGKSSFPHPTGWFPKAAVLQKAAFLVKSGYVQRLLSLRVVFQLLRVVLFS